MVSGRLADRVALITGSSSGLGRAIAFAFAAEGAKICCVDLYPSLRSEVDKSRGTADSIHNRNDRGQSTHGLLSEEFGKDRFIFVRADCTSARDVEHAIQSCVESFGRLDILVNNAGISVESQHQKVLRVHETTEEDYDKTMAVNTKGVFLCCKYGIRQMLAQEPLSGSSGARGWIINTASIQSIIAFNGTPSYTAAKSAVAGLTRQIALDYAADKIHCNALSPGFLTTAMTTNVQSDSEILKKVGDAHPWGGGGLGKPEDVARAALFLASDDVAWVQGVNLPVDGGFLCH